MIETGQTRTDDELVRATLAGSPESFVLLIRRYQHLVFGLCRNMLGCREEALDASQDAFIAMFKSLKDLRGKDDFRAWLRKIATNVCRQRLRTRRMAGELDDCMEGGDTYKYVDQAIDMNRAVGRLKPETRITVLLFYFEGSSVREIARFLGVPETTVMSRLRNARAQLRQDLNIMFEEPTKQRSSLPQDFAERIPIPYDEYKPYDASQEFQPLSDWRRDWILSVFPPGSSVSSSEALGYDWEPLHDRAIQVTVRRPEGQTEPVVLRMSGRKDGIRLESELLPVLASLGLPVPRVVAGPSLDPDFPDRGMLLATTPPPGRSALEWAVEGGTMAIDHTCDVVMEGIEWIKSVTGAVESNPVANLLERCSLSDELARIIEIGGPWMTDEGFTRAIHLLEPVVQEIDVPLVFSDSGIGPNARVDEEGKLLGFESFSWARIEDPHYQIAKYWTYDCWPIRRAGFVERYLLRHKLSMSDFAPRLGVRALVTLQREIPLRGGDGSYRNDMLGWLKLGLDNLP